MMMMAANPTEFDQLVCATPMKEPLENTQQDSTNSPDNMATQR